METYAEKEWTRTWIVPHVLVFRFGILLPRNKIVNPMNDET